MAKKKQNSERKEFFMRIVVAIVSGIVLNVWKFLIFVLAILQWILMLFAGKRNEGLANFMEYWNTEVYKYIRYLTGVCNDRPFPFSGLERMSKFKK